MSCGLSSSARSLGCPRGWSGGDWNAFGRRRLYRFTPAPPTKPHQEQIARGPGQRGEEPKPEAVSVPNARGVLHGAEDERKRERGERADEAEYAAGPPDSAASPKRRERQNPQQVLRREHLGDNDRAEHAGRSEE